MWPDADAVAAVFERLVQGDRVAVSDFIAAVLEPLANHLCAWRRDADEHTCLSAAEDAVLSLIHNPAIYDPAKRGLIGFLRMAAEGDLLNELEKEKKHNTNRENRDCVELTAKGGNSIAEELADDLPSFDDPSIAAEIANFTATEREVFYLMRDGERRTSAFAVVLSIDHLPVEDQAREVKRVKERLFKRLQRTGRKS
jgi:hypothetical protein